MSSKGIISELMIRLLQRNLNFSTTESSCYPKKWEEVFSFQRTES